jgi:hypothetical protein
MALVKMRTTSPTTFEVTNLCDEQTGGTKKVEKYSLHLAKRLILTSKKLNIFNFNQIYTRYY